MSTITHSDMIVRAYNSDKKVHIMQDVFVSRVFAWPGTGMYGTIMRLNSKLEPIWRRSLFIEDGYYGGDVQGRECALTRDGQYLYVVGANLTSGTDNFYKLNAATGETIWSKESTNPYYKLAVDNKDDAIIWEEHGGPPPTGKLRKYNAAGVIQWTLTLNKVSAIATDSDRNIYVTHVDEVGGYTIRKLDPDGTFVWGAAIHTGGASHAGDVAINKDDEIFVVGSASGTAGAYHRIYKYNTSSSALITSAPVGSGVGSSVVKCVVCDSKGNPIAGGPSAVDKYNSSLVSQWYGIYSTGQNVQLAIDCQNRVHIFSARHDGDEGGYLILDEDETFASYSGPFLWNIYGAVMAKEVYVAHYTDQDVNMFRDDMCCFQDDTIDEYVEPPYAGQWNTDDIVYHDYYFGGARAEHLVGIFKSLVDNNDGLVPGENDLAWEMLNLVPPCGNADWNAFAGFGGIGNSPQIYTVTFYGLLIVGSGAPSPYNGEFLIRRGPGTFGFFFGVQHNDKTRLNFEAEDDKDSAGSETLQFGTESLISSIFNYTAASTNPGKWINIANSNTDSAPSIAYDGTASLYPGRIARWDATTNWADGIIVAWQGTFYRANTINQNDEPPSAAWTAIV